MTKGPIKMKKAEKAYIFIPADIKKSSKELATKRKISLSQLVARLLKKQ